MPSFAPLFIPSLGIGELALVLVLVLLLFGPGKLPKVAESLGEAVKRFRSGSEGKALPESPAAPADDSSDKP